MIQTRGEYKPLSKKNNKWVDHSKNLKIMNYESGEYPTKPLNQGGGGSGTPPKEEEEEEEGEEEESEGTGTDESESEETDVEPDESEDDPGGDDDVDFEAELKKERERLGKKIDKEREKRIAAQKSKGLSQEDVERMVDERATQIERKFIRGKAEDIAERLSGGDISLKELIILKYDKSIIHSGSLEEDMENAFALATRKASSAKISELRAAAKSKQNRAISSGAGAPPQKSKTEKYSQDDIDGASFAGVSVEDFVKHKKTVGTDKNL